MAVENVNLDALQALDDTEPVTMVNLVRLREVAADGRGSGWDSYQRYSVAVTPMIKSRGGTILWAGKAEAVALGVPSDTNWDFVVLVHYPSRAAFIDMITSREYEEDADPHRRNGVLEHVILATRTSYSKFKDA